MISDLKKNYKLIISFLVSTAVALIIIQPFILANIHVYKKITAILCLSTAFLITMTFQSILFPNLFSPKLNYRDWSLSKQVPFNIWLLFITGLISFLLISTFYVNRGLSFLFVIMLNTFAIYSLPQFIFTLFLIREKKEFNNIIKIAVNKAETESAVIKLCNGKDFLIDEDLAYIKAEDNYVALFYLINEKVVKRMERISISKIEHNNNSNFIRCHRSYIVNLNAIEKIVKQKLRFYIKLNGIENLIPVSRGKMQFFRNFPIANSPQK